MGLIEESKTDWWDKLMMNTGRKMTATFEDNNDGFVNALILTSGTRHMMRWLYRHMINKGRIKAIESLDIESKKEIWSFIRDVCSGKTNDKEVMKEVAMAFQVIEYFINSKDK